MLMQTILNYTLRYEIVMQKYCLIEFKLQHSTRSVFDDTSLMYQM